MRPVCPERLSRCIVAAAVLYVAIGCRGSGADETAARDGVRDTTAADSIARSVVYRGGTLEISNVVAPAPVPAGNAAPPVAVYFLVMNNGARSDTLDAVEISDGSATLHDQVPATGTRRQSMIRIDGASIPAGEMLRFIPGGRHVMVEGLTRPLSPGEVLPLTMVFRHAGRVAVGARIVDYAELESVIAAGADEHAGH